MEIQTYLYFDGRCEEALEFYRETLGAEVVALVRFKDVPGSCAPDAEDGREKVLHAAFRIGEATLMASDGECTGNPEFRGFGLSLPAPTDAEAERLFGLLSRGGTVHQPLQPAFFSSRFGIVADRFGVGWMVLTRSNGVPRPAH